MKSLACLLVLFLVAQPLQAGFCTMGTASHPAAQAGMGHEHAGGKQAHDCCQQQAPKQGHDCSTASHCGACAVGHSAVSAISMHIEPPACGYRFASVESGLPPSHSSPPFRPPILNS